MDINIATLSENTANQGFLAEWGLAQEFEGIFFMNNAGTCVTLP